MEHNKDDREALLEVLAHERDELRDTALAKMDEFKEARQARLEASKPSDYDTLYKNINARYPALKKYMDD